MAPNEGLWKIPVGVIIPFLVVIALAVLLRDSFLVRLALYLGIFVASLCASVAVLLLRFHLSVENGRPQLVLSQLAHSLRVSGFIVKEEKDTIRVQVNSMAAVKIRARAVEHGTVITYTADATSAGWVVWVVLVLFGYGAILSLPIAVYFFVKARKMAHKSVLPRLESTGAIPKSPSEFGTSDILADGLAEGRRLAKEAYEVTKSNYEDGVILSILAFIVLLASSLIIAFVLVQVRGDFWAIVALALSLLLSGGVGFVMIRHLAKTRKPLIDEFSNWERRLGKELELQTQGDGKDMSTSSTLELLLDVSLEIPKWEKARSRGFFYLSPGNGILLLGCVFLVYTGLSAMGASAGNSSLLILGSVMIVAGIVGATLLNRIWKREVREEQAEFKKAWSGRIDAIRSNMERILGGI